MKFILLLPVCLFYILFTVWPLVEVIRLSLYKTNFMKTTFVLFDNYKYVLTDPDFLQSILNSVFYSILLVPGQILVALFFALLLYNMTKKWQDVSRIIFYIPVLSAGIIISNSWKWIFHIDGPINWILSIFNIDAVGWFAQGSTAIPVISLIVVFASFGGNLIIMLASILSIDKAILESAQIDGASVWKINLYIIIPLILPVIGLVGLLSMINAFQIFENIYMLAPQTYAATMTFFIYQQGFMFSKYGLAAAEAVVLLFIVVSLSVMKGRLSK